MSGIIYLITNLINSKVYVGQTRMTLKARWNKHCTIANSDPCATGVDGAIRKYGKKNFTCEVIKTCPIEELDKWEIYYIQFYHSYQRDNANKGYNLTLGGGGGWIYDFDIDEIISMCNNGLSLKEIAAQYHCCPQTISARLRAENIDIKSLFSNWCKSHPESWENNLSKGHRFTSQDNNKAVRIKELDKIFPSLAECSQWLIDNHYTKAATMDAVRKSLSRHLNGERNSYLKMHFEFI